MALQLRVPLVRWCASAHGSPYRSSLARNVIGRSQQHAGLKRCFSSSAGHGTLPVRILRSDVTDICYHFAVEEYLMSAAKILGPVLYLWRPSKVVTIGRHQNPWKECKLAQLEEDSVALVRRRSGGGCVFQDPGCSVFTLIAPSGVFSIDRNMNLVLGALGRCGIKAEKQGRNDITYEGRKISGSAFKHSPDRGVSLHHGTILVDTDLQALQRYLTPDKRKLQAKGISSVGARVMNLREEFSTLDHQGVCEAFVQEFMQVEGGTGTVVEELDENSAMAQDPIFRSIREELQSDDWRLGRTPDFSHQLETRIDGVGVFDVRLEVVNGKVKEAVIFSDALFPEVITQAMSALTDAEYGRRGLRAALAPLSERFEDEGPRLLVSSFTNWLVENVDD